jgi:hypothetical protein
LEHVKFEKSGDARGARLRCITGGAKGNVQGGDSENNQEIARVISELHVEDVLRLIWAELSGRRPEDDR